MWLWGPVAVQMTLIFIASSIPHLGALPGGLSDKGGHSIGYAMLGALVLRAFAGGRLSGVTWPRAAAALLVATFYGVSDEFHQSFVPGRTPDAYDVLADCSGAAIAIAFVAVAAVAHACGILKRSS
jgi:VanZ family protein